MGYKVLSIIFLSLISSPDSEVPHYYGLISLETQIRLETKGGRHSSVIFCTNGVLLRVLVSKGTGRLKAASPKVPEKDAVSDITHIIVVLVLFNLT